MPEDDMAAAIAQAATMEKAETDAAAATGTETRGSATDERDGETELSSGESTDGEDPADDAGDDDDPSSDNEAEESVPDYASVGQQIVDGDLAGACKLLGIDPKILNINVPKFEAMRKGLKETRTREANAVTLEAQAEQKVQRADAVIADGKKKYGELVDLKLSLKAGDFYAARELLEALAPDGTPIKTILEGIAAAAKNLNPAELTYKRKLRELAIKEQADRDAAEAKKAADTAAADEASRAQRNQAGATKLLKGTAYEGLPGAVEALVKLAAEHWDPVKKGLKKPPTELVKLLAKDPVLGQLAELKRLKGKPAAPPQVVNKNKTRTPTGQFTKLAPTKAQKLETERKASIAEAARLEARDARARRAR